MQRLSMSLTNNNFSPFLGRLRWHRLHSPSKRWTLSILPAKERKTRETALNNKAVQNDLHLFHFILDPRYHLRCLQRTFLTMRPISFQCIHPCSKFTVVIFQFPQMGVPASYHLIEFC